jgi:2-C-methyl-D-erythritol 2,4-cyclodiphosphate synthase
VTDLRYGLGFDVHPRSDEPSSPFRLGGIEFEDVPGLAGHSDADVVCHALGDALLGAAALGDLGEHFPEHDPAVAGLPGAELLARVVALLEEAGLRPHSCDLNVIAATPAIEPRRDEIRSFLAGALGVPIGSVSVKATRPEGLGLAGDGAGCLALAAVEPA